MVVKIVIKTLYLWVYLGYMFIYTCNLITVLVSHCKHLIDYFISKKNCDIYILVLNTWYLKKTQIYLFLNTN